MLKNEIISLKVPAGKRTYFFDIKETREKEKYLVISESQKNAKGEYHHDRVMVFEEHFSAFYEAMQKISREFGLE